jgi:hypothetical protein
MMRVQNGEGSSIVQLTDWQCVCVCVCVCGGGGLCSKYRATDSGEVLWDNLE